MGVAMAVGNAADVIYRAVGMRQRASLARAGHSIIMANARDIGLVLWAPRRRQPRVGITWAEENGELPLHHGLIVFRSPLRMGLKIEKIVRGLLLDKRQDASHPHADLAVPIAVPIAAVRLARGEPFECGMIIRHRQRELLQVILAFESTRGLARRLHC